MFDDNSLDRIPEDIRAAYEKAFTAAVDGAMDAFKKLPKLAKEALDNAGLKELLNDWASLSDKIGKATEQLKKKKKHTEDIIDLTQKLNETMKEGVDIESTAATTGQDRSLSLVKFVQSHNKLNTSAAQYNVHLRTSQSLLQSLVKLLSQINNIQQQINNAARGPGGGGGSYGGGGAGIIHQGPISGGGGSGLRARPAWSRWSGRYAGPPNNGPVIPTIMPSGGGGGGGGGAIPPILPTGGPPGGAGGDSTLMRDIFRLLGLLAAIPLRAYQDNRDFGYGVGASAGNVTRSFGDMGKNFLATGGITGPLAGSRIRNELSNSLGTRNVDDSTFRTSADMVSYYRLSVQEATRANASIRRNVRFNAVQAENDYKLIQGVANKGGMSPGEILKDVSRYGDIYATYAEKGAAAFARSALEVRKIGMNMGQVSSFADSMVNDLQSSLMMQAKVQTLMPGTDFSELMYASQFGSEGDVATALKTALGGQNITSMPRSLRNMISGATGLSMSQLKALDAGNAPGTANVGAVSPEDADRNALGTFVGSIDGAVRSLTVFNGALMLSALNVARGIGGGMGPLGAVLGGGALLLGGGLAGLGQYSSSKAKGDSTGTAAIKGGATGLTSIILGLGGAALGTALFGPGIGTYIGGALGGMAGAAAGNFFGDMFGNGQGEVRHGGGISGKGLRNYRTVSPDVFMGAARYHKGIMPDEIPSILQRGEAVLSRAQVQGLAQMMTTHQALGSNLPSAPEFQLMNNAATAYTSMPQASSSPAQPSMGTTRIESLLEQLISHTKDGKTIQIDGRKVGSTIVTAYGRE